MECKSFAEEFEEAFGKPPALFFSGGRDVTYIPFSNIGNIMISIGA